MMTDGEIHGGWSYGDLPARGEDGNQGEHHEGVYSVFFSTCLSIALGLFPVYQ